MTPDVYDHVVDFSKFGVPVQDDDQATYNFKIVMLCLSLVNDLRLDCVERFTVWHDSTLLYVKYFIHNVNEFFQVIPLPIQGVAFRFEKERDLGVVLISIPRKCFLITR